MSSNPATATLAPSPTALDWSVQNCGLGRTMAFLGERWTVVVLREVFLGVRRFADIQRHAGVPKQVLSDRLATLVDAEILTRVPYQDAGTRTRHEYRLTPRGRELEPIMVALTQWGDRHLADPAGPARDFRHRDCGAPVRVAISCSEGHTDLARRDIENLPGPGAIRQDV